MSKPWSHTSARVAPDTDEPQPRGGLHAGYSLYHGHLYFSSLLCFKNIKNSLYSKSDKQNAFHWFLKAGWKLSESEAAAVTGDGLGLGEARCLLAGLSQKLNVQVGPQAHPGLSAGRGADHSQGTPGVTLQPAERGLEGVLGDLH